MIATQVDDAVGHEPTLQDVTAQLSAARQRTDDLFALVKPEFLYERPIAERHRIIFYIGHLEAFDWNLLHEHALGLKTFHPEFDRLFAFGIDPVGGGLPNDQPSDWPSIAAVREYVKTIRQSLDDKLAVALADSRPATRDGFSLSTLLNVAIEHRLMHAETLAYMLHQSPLHQKMRQHEPAEIVTPAVDYGSVEIPAGAVTLGMARGSGVFGWDNEYTAHTVNVPAFAIDRYKVTNRAVSRVHRGGRIRDSLLLEQRQQRCGLELEISARHFTSGVLEARRRSVVVSHDVRRCSASIGLAGLRQPGRGESLRALGREVAAYRSRVATRRRWQHRRRTGLSVGRSRS